MAPYRKIITINILLRGTTLSVGKGGDDHGTI